MWLPTPIYQRVPDVWVLLGLLFLSLALYIGLDFDLFLVYAAVGVLCIARGMWIYGARFACRRTAKTEPQQAEPDQSTQIELDQTGATHV